MTATTRWVEYDVSAKGATSDGDNGGKGTRGYSLATASVNDTFDIAYSNNRFWFTLDGITTEYVTIASGTNLDPRFIAKDITEKIHNLNSASTRHQYARCTWENNAFKLYSGTIGSSSSASVVSGTNTAHLTLGFGTKTEVGGIAASNGYTDGITISGSYEGFFDEVYKIVISADIPVQTPVKGGSNSYTGAITTGGAYNNSTSITYTLSIDTSNGTTMGAGSGNVPKLSWTSTGNVDNGGPLELLYPNYWYYVGTKGLMVKFSDAVFNTCDPAWTITCNAVQYVEGSNTSGPAGTAKYYWGSDRGDNASTTYTTSNSSYTQLGSRGVYIKFTGASSTNFNAGDEFYVLCRAPQPKSYDITNLNYGNVTVSTESTVKTVMFELTSGAVEISTVKFGLQNHGTFQHHTTGDNDTYFRFGTVGPGNTAGASPISGREWRDDVAPSDISSDTPPSYLHATKANLNVVADADNSEAIGSSTYCGMVADPIWLGIRLGASEVGANSTINYRIFFDYS